MFAIATAGRDTVLTVIGRQRGKKIKKSFMFNDPFPCRDFPLKGEAAIIESTAKRKSLVAKINQSFLPLEGELSEAFSRT